MILQPLEPLRVSLPSAFRPLLIPRRYKVPYGGRGGAKSWNVARVLIGLAYTSTKRILCAREIQASIRESVHHLLAEQISMMGLDPWFTVREKAITSHTGSEFLFKGLRHNVREIKSTEGVDICWVEEAENVSDNSWLTLIPTIRKPDSEIWITFNPADEKDPTYKRFVLNPPPEAWVQKVSYRDNPHFPAVLESERLYLQRVDPDAYQHVWEGFCSKSSAAQILYGKWSVDSFEAGGDGWDGPYFGLDFGFSQDPTAAVKLWIKGRTLYVEYEEWAIGCDIDKTPELLDKIPGMKGGVTRADCARPETISYLQRHGYPSVVPVPKWAGSVEDGVTHLRSYEKIVIHTRCKHTAEEARLYSYKVDRLSGDILADVVDANNHIWDAVRYALNPMIQNNKMGALAFIADQQREAEERKNAERRS